MSFREATIYDAGIALIWEGGMLALNGRTLTRTRPFRFEIGLRPMFVIPPTAIQFLG